MHITETYLSLPPLFQIEMENNVAESRLRRRVPEDGENSDSFLGRVRDYLVNGQAAARGGGQPDNIREETERLANFVVYSSLR